jgi:hypothetical protein
MIPVSLIVAVSALVWVFWPRRRRPQVTVNDVKVQVHEAHENTNAPAEAPAYVRTGGKVAVFDGVNVTKEVPPLPGAPSVMPPSWAPQSYSEASTDVANSIGQMARPTNVAQAAESFVDTTCGGPSGDPGYATRLANTLLERGVVPAVTDGYTTGDPKTDEAVLQAQLDATAGVPSSMNADQLAASDLALSNNASSGFVATSFMTSRTCNATLIGPAYSEDN